MKTSQNGINLIKKYEGCKLEAYICPAGVWTIGWGHTGADVAKGKKITQAEAEALLIKDLAIYEDKVNKYQKYNFNQNQFDALVSFAYNIGSIDQLTNNGKRTIDEIAKAMPLYNKAGGKVLQGLANRRAAEVELFERRCGTIIFVNNKPVEVDFVNLDGHTYIRLRDLTKIAPSAKIKYKDKQIYLDM